MGANLNTVTQEEQRNQAEYYGMYRIGVQSPDFDDGKNFCDGAIDDVRLYSRALIQSEIQDIINMPVGLRPAQLFRQSPLVTVQPNPFSGCVKICLGSQAQKAEVKIFSVDGRLKASFTEIKSNSVIWNASGVNSGLYIIAVKAKGKILYKRITLLR
jgi:hypothetical protein